jgi:5-formyltetrahydrofolate cyclo-ligase
MKQADAMARPTIASAEEDPNATVACSSPPCFLHELDPSYLGYLRQDEVAALLGALFTLPWPESQQAMLRQYLAGLPAAPTEAVPSEPLALRLRQALPRLYDHALRDALRPLLEQLETRPSGWEAVRRWRKAQRAALLASRLAVPRERREALDAAITTRLGPWLPSTGLIGFYWPFKGEYDPRPLMHALHLQGVRLALPVVVAKAQPLVFREWWPGIRMAPGVWNIPVPAEGEPVRPVALVVPLLGFDAQGYRLGYGGGYYDRTLAALVQRPWTIGVGLEQARLETIHPQPHDIPMELIVTEQRILRPDAGPRQ